MSKFISENQEGYTKKSWINNLMNNKVLQANLTEEYAHDILESVADETFSSLDDAIADLSRRIGLTASEVGIIKTAAIAMVRKADEEIPGNIAPEEKPAGAEAGLTKTTEEEGKTEVASSCSVKKAGIEHLKEFQFKKKEETQEEHEKGESKAEEKAEEKAEKSASLKERLHRAWFQGSDKPSSKEDGGTNDPAKMGYPKELKYDHAPMATTAPGGENTRPWEQKWFEGAATDTKKVMGPQGEEFKTKVEMQRIPKGEKEANARMKAIKQIVTAYKK